MKIDARSIIGKTVTGLISRPAPDGTRSLVMLQFSDGSCFEFVSPAFPSASRSASRRSSGGRHATALERAAAAQARSETIVPQLSMFPLDGTDAAAAA